MLPADSTLQSVHVRFFDGKFEFRPFREISPIDWSHPDEDDDPLHEEYLEDLQDDLRPYLNAGLVERIPPADGFDLNRSPMTGLESVHPDLWFSILSGTIAVVATDGDMQDEFLCDDFFHESIDRQRTWTAVSIDVSRHLTRTDLSSNLAFDLPYRSENVNALLSEAAFKIVLPVVSKISVDDVIELRERTEDFREGFRSYIQSISLEARQMASAGADIVEIRGHCEDLVVTHLAPLLSEHQRQLAALKAQKLAGRFEILSKFLEIETGPWAPKFWTELFNILSASTNETATEIMEKKSNLSLTLNLLRLVEGEAKALPKVTSFASSNKCKSGKGKQLSLEEAIKKYVWGRR